MTSVNKMMSDNSYINMREMLKDDNGRNLRGLIEIIVRKNALKPLGSIFLDYHEKTGVVCVRKNGKSTSKPVSLKDFSPFNEPVKKLIKELDLEEELPF